MCGFFGCFHNRNFSIDKDFFIKISGSIKHRGPDASGYKEFILKVPNSSNELDLKLGNEIKVGWNSQDARALDPK